MGLLRNFAHTLFGIALLAALWVTALTFLTMRGPSTAVITDLGVDALNPWLVTKGVGLDTTAYAKLEQAASAYPSKPLPLTFIKPQVLGSEIKGVPYSEGVRIIYTHVADAYYDGGASAAFALPAPLAAAVQSFALFPQQYDTAVKATPLPSFVQPFLLNTGLTPETFTAKGHARIADIQTKVWLPTLALAGIIVLLNLLSRKPLVTSLALTIWNGSWPTLAVFAVLWVIGHLYPASVHAVAAASGVVAGQFVPVYAVAAIVGVGAYLVTRFASSLFKSAMKAATPAVKTPVPAATRASSAYNGYTDRVEQAPPYSPNAPSSLHASGWQASGPGQSAAQQGWQQPARQAWDQQPANPTWQQQQPAGPTWQQQQQGASPQGWGQTTQQSPYDQTQQSPYDQTQAQGDWNAARPWDAQSPAQPPAQPRPPREGPQRWDLPPLEPDDPTPPRW